MDEPIFLIRIQFW